MSEMIERVARAIRTSRAEGDDDWHGAARAAIEAMREPTEAQLLAGVSVTYLESPTEVIAVWQEMIDSAILDAHVPKHSV